MFLKLIRTVQGEISGRTVLGDVSYRRNKDNLNVIDVYPMQSVSM